MGWESDSDDNEPIMTQVIPKPPPTPPNSVNLYHAMGEAQALKETGSFAGATPKKSKKHKPSPPPSTDGHPTGRRRRRNRPDMEMRMRCKMVAGWIEVNGPSAFTAVSGCDMDYLRALLRDKVDITNTVLDTK